MVRRLCALLACTILVCTGSLGSVPAGAAGAEKAYAPYKGTVGYQLAPDAPFQQVFGRTDLPDNAYAVTRESSLATLALPDSSEIAIGERTIVQVGAFNSATTGRDNTVTLNNGALRFKIVHPAGTASNYTFKTSTSQIAVRGTEAYLIEGPNGTQMICVDCAPGDVTVTVAGQGVPLLTGQTITITPHPPGSPTFVVTTIDKSYNPAVEQFLLLLGKRDIAFAPEGAAGTDPTGYLLAAGHVAAIGILPIIVEAGVIGALVSSTTKSNTSTPTPTPTPIPTPTGTPTLTPYSPLVISPSELSFNGVGGAAQTFSVTQSGPGGAISIGQPTCYGDGAAATDTPNTLTITPAGGAQTVSVSAVTAPTSATPPTHACQIIVSGGAGTQATVYLDITSTVIGVKGKRGASTEPAAAPTPTPFTAPLPPSPPGARPPH
jgi:hypothetical protein